LLSGSPYPVENVRIDDAEVNDARYECLLDAGLT
jgi:hypothetical protein